MNPEPLLEQESELELERYEMFAGPAYHFAFGRRDLLKALGGGLAVVLLLRDASSQDPQGRGQGGRGPGGRGQGGPSQIGAFVHIGQDGTVTCYTGKVEIGQDTRTGLTLVAAEELRVPVAQVRMVMGDTDLVPYDQGTFGSRSVPSMVPQLRRAAAAARELLVELASKHWQVERNGLTVADGHVVQADGKTRVAFGELTKGEKLVHAISADPPTTAAKDWKVCGQPATKVNAKDIVTGRHRYSADQTRPGMLHGKVLRPIAFGATPASVDLAKAQAIAGVVAVHDGSFLGVAAPDEATALRALAAIQVEWKTPEQPVSHRNLFEHLKKGGGRGGGGGGGGGRGGGNANAGSMDEGLAAADHKLSASYTLPYIAHAPLEPRAALAEWTTDGRLDVMAGTQSPFGLRAALAQAFRIDEQKVRVRVPDVGSGYGGKNRGGDAAVEAARLAKAAGKPVRVVWTREEEFTWAYFRPAGVIAIESGVKQDGTLTAWQLHNWNSGGSGLETPYQVPHRDQRVHGSDSPLAQGSYRALAATANHFARESHMDDLARLVGMDPLAFRVKNLTDQRILAVLKAAAERFGWGTRKPEPGRGFGLACGTEKASFVATCAEVSAEKDGAGLRVVRLVTAFECGALLHPSNVENQVMGGVIMALGGALTEAIEFEGGRILNPRFSQYRVPRFLDVPQIETVLLDRKDLPSVGAGETPLVCVAPAIGNALCAVTGKRRTALPLG